MGRKWQALRRKATLIQHAMPLNELSAKERAIEHYRSRAPWPAKPGEATEAYKGVDELAYILSRLPTFTARPLKIIAVGAGFSGLSIARAVHAGKLPNASITVYEKNAGVGGTWYENRYPGFVCLVSSCHVILVADSKEVTTLANIVVDVPAIFRHPIMQSIALS